MIWKVRNLKNVPFSRYFCFCYNLLCIYNIAQVLDTPAAATRERSLDIVLPIMFITIASLTLLIAVLSFLLIKTQLNKSHQNTKPDASQYEQPLQPMISSSSAENMDNSTPTTPSISIGYGNHLYHFMPNRVTCMITSVGMVTVIVRATIHGRT